MKAHDQLTSQHQGRVMRLRGFGLSLAALLAVSGLAGCAPDAPDRGSAPAAPVLSDQESSRLIQEALDQQWTSVLQVDPGASRPQFEVVRTVSLTEYAEAQVACLQERGFAATLGDSASIDIEITSAELEVNYAHALYECAALYPLDPIYRAPLTAEELEFIYSYWTEELVPCLENAGFTVSDAPSKTAFVDSYGKADGWVPFSEAMQSSGQVSSEEVTQLGTTCPEYPSGMRE